MLLRDPSVRRPSIVQISKLSNLRAHTHDSLGDGYYTSVATMTVATPGNRPIRAPAVWIQDHRLRPSPWKIERTDKPVSTSQKRQAWSLVLLADYLASRSLRSLPTSEVLLFLFSCSSLTVDRKIDLRLGINNQLVHHLETLQFGTWVVSETQHRKSDAINSAEFFFGAVQISRVV